MTEIFESYIDFLNRENLKVNGVSKEFAEQYHNWEEMNSTNKACWNCSDCSRCSGCSGCSDCSRCSRCSDCSDCSGCSDCSDCSGCWNCSGCSRCWNCSGLRKASSVEASESNNVGFVVPIIKDIHQKVFNAAREEGALKMDQWHACNTTHCRAGWVVVLAGKEGKELEEQTSTLFAAQQIYKASSPIRVSPTRFFESNTKALDDMRSCAEKEATS